MEKAILNYQDKLIDRISNHYEIDERLSNKDCQKLLLIEFNKVRNICKEKKIKFVYGQGKRKIEEQKRYELLKEWLNRLKTYENHLSVLGERNSYSKTDKDATFMRLKDDHMKNGQLKPAYNIQCATNGNYIIEIEGFNNPSDSRTLIPFTNNILDKYNGKINKIVADSGYESEENYLYLKENGLKNLYQTIKS